MSLSLLTRLMSKNADKLNKYHDKNGIILYNFNCMEVTFCLTDLIF